MSHTPLRRTAIACGLALVIALTAAPDAHADQIDGTLHFTGTGMLESYCQKWCLTIDSSGGLVDVGHFDSIVEFHPSNHLDQIIESS